MLLTDSKIKALKAGERLQRLADGGGLYLEVSPTGAKTFRLRFYQGKDRKWLTLGPYPKVKLAEARLARETVKDQVRRGEQARLGPAEPEPQCLAPDPSFLWKNVALSYVALRRANGAAPRTLKKLEYQIGQTIAVLGEMRVDEVTAQDVLRLVRPIAASGAVESAHEVRTRCSQVFRFAIAEGRAQMDPASFTIDAMVKRRRGEFAGITEPDEVGRLMLLLQENRKAEPQVRAALLLSAYLFPRNSELRGMRWSEIDWQAALWEIPAERMKMKRAHLVPLPHQALTILRELRCWTGRVQLVIPAPRDWSRWVSDNTFNKALRGLGIPPTRHVHHGFRKTFSSNMNEKGWNKDWIEKQLAHEEANKVRRSYNKAEYLDGRTELMQAYADWLDARAEEAAAASGGEALSSPY